MLDPGGPVAACWRGRAWGPGDPRRVRSPEHAGAAAPGEGEWLGRGAKVVSQRAYGYSTFAAFQLALYHVMGDLPMPETTHRFL
jgi:hypothetical protein